ncbi:MAG: ATP-dependent helicase [Myxococcales bacterium]|nr:ATP-dependent helicase [Myxococcales bacterium]
MKGKALAIAQTPASPLRVLAGPGTGKSYAMMRRVARLVEQGTAPERVLAVTFTRTAAADLKREVGQLGIAGCDKVDAGTLHAFCFRTLQQAAVLAQTGRHPRPLVTFTNKQVMQFEAKPMLSDLDPKYGDQRAKSKRVLAYEAAWARQQHQTPGFTLKPIDKAFEADLVSWLRFHEAMVLGELIPQALEYLRTNPTAPVLSAFDHVVVDEYQDLNRAEQDLIDLLAKAGSLSIVGDEDQSIYRFRHANPDGIRDFDQTHSSTHDETLDECRRCPQKVVSIADHLIRNNHPSTIPTRLKPMAGNPAGDVYIVQWKDLAAEIAGLSDYVRELVRVRRVDPGDVLILSPRKYIGYELRDAITSHGIDAHSFYNEEALDTDEAQLAFTLLTLQANPDDIVAYRFWLGHGSQDWRRRQYETLRTAAATAGRSPREVLADVVAGNVQLSGVANLKTRQQALEAALAALGGLVGDALVDALFDPQEPWAEAAQKAWQKVKDPTADAATILDLLRTEVTHPEVPDADAVRIMSLHKSKGLTSRVVIVTSCVQGLIPVPAANPAEAAAVEREQRRLFYVALTRATDTLVLSSCAGVDRALAYRLGMQVRGRARAVSFVASQFFKELGPTAPRPETGPNWEAAGYR